jgi:hypothetical protein
VWPYLYQMTGVDLTQIDGIDVLSALKIISEIGHLSPECKSS